MMSSTGRDLQQTAPGAPWIRELRGPYFQLALPSGWADRSIYSAAGPLIEGKPPAVTITIEFVPDAQDLATFVRDQVTQQAGQLNDYEPLKNEKRQIGTRVGYWVEFQWKTPDGMIIHQVQWFIYKAPHVFAITGSATPKMFDQFREQFESIARGFLPLDCR